MTRDYDIYFTSVHVEHTVIKADNEDDAYIKAESLLGDLFDEVFDLAEAQNINIEVRPVEDNLLT